MKLLKYIEDSFKITIKSSNQNLRNFKDLRKLLIQNNIKTLIIKTEIKSSTKLLFPCFIKSKNGSFYLIIEKNETMINLIDEDYNILSLNYDELKSNFLDEILLMEKVNGVYKDYFHYNVNNIISKITLALFTLVFVFAFLFSNIVLLFQIVNLFGCYLLIISLLNEYDLYQLNWFCTSSSCSGLPINSNIKIKISLLGFIFFSFSFLYVFISNKHLNDFLLLLFQVSFFLLPFSIYLFMKHKIFCKICTLIWSLIIIQTYLLYTYYTIFEFSFMNLTWVLFSFSFASLGAIWLYNYLQNNHFKIKRRTYVDLFLKKPEVVKMFLSQADSLNIEYDRNYIVGNRNGKIIIDTFLHIHCVYCIDTLKDLINLCILNSNIGVRFNVSFDYSNKFQIEMYKLFLKKCKLNKYDSIVESFIQMKNDNKNFKLEEPFDNSIIIPHKTNFNFKKFPVTYINGKQLPDFVSISDLKEILLYE